MSFVHVHNHTEYSLLDGANRVPKMVAKAAEMGMEALAITDHGVMFGAMEFYFECQKHGIKPLIGMEAYVAPNGLHLKRGREENQTYHLLLLAKDLEGYRNLCKLHSIAALQGYYFKPRIDHELLRAHAKGLIGTSACLGSEVCQQLLAGDYDGAQRTAGMYKEIFDEHSFFIELQDHNIPEQRQIEPQLVRIAQELKLPLVATNDAHYLCRGDAEAHDVLLCIGTGSQQCDERRLRFPSPEFYLKSPDEMAQLFAHHPGAIESTLRIAEACNLELSKQQAMMPQPELPEGVESEQHLRTEAERGLAERYSAVSDEARARLEYELDVIGRTGFADYILLVQEFAKFTRSSGIAFGARGSAAGSLVSYCLGITDIDPLEYDLTFERFLNPERVSMPDIDLDFEDARRDEVLRWVTERYGSDRVAQIVTFGTLGAKAAIRDAGRVMGYSPQDADRICKTLPNTPGLNLDRAGEIAEFRAILDANPNLRKLVDVAKTVEGLARHSGVHAAGVVISRDPLMEHIPLYRGADGQAITAYEMGILEKIGLLKMDFLGLSNLTALTRTINLIRDTRGVELNLRELPLDDAKTYEMLGRGETVGVFQLESAGMRLNIKELKPTSIRDLAAMVALYRPGPIKHISQFIQGKYGKVKPTYLDERMRPILEETYGVIVYQDQVLKLVQALAGFSLGKADVLRRAMGKKDEVAMRSMNDEFLEGCAQRGIHRKHANQVWDLLLPFAGYAFNKAHAICYALIAYQTAYLKAHYPVEYMAALLAVYQTKDDRVTAFIEESRRSGIKVLPPDVNRSTWDFSIEPDGETNCIRFGLAAIKGVGEGLANGLILARGGKPGDPGHKPFDHLYEFCDRTKDAGMNRTALEALIRAGALDSIDRNRNRLLAVADAALVHADQAYRNRQAGQDSLFGDSPEVSFALPVLPEQASPTRGELLAMEKEVMGIYVSDHPLRGFERTVKASASCTCAAALELEDGTQVTLAGVIAGLRPVITKKGDRMATLTLEDFSGQVPCTVFPATYQRIASLLHRDQVVSIRGAVTHRERPGSRGEKVLEVRVDELSHLTPDLIEPASDEDAEEGTLALTICRATASELATIREGVESFPGNYRLLIRFGENAVEMPVVRRIDCMAFVNFVRNRVQCVAELDGVRLEATPALPELAQVS